MISPFVQTLPERLTDQFDTKNWKKSEVWGWPGCVQNITDIIRFDMCMFFLRCPWKTGFGFQFRRLWTSLGSMW